MTEWFADEAFWKIFYPGLFPPDQFKIAEEEVEQILNLLEFNGSSILDLACGPGRHSIVLAKKGFRVTGVDLSAFLLGKAKERASGAGVNVEWVHQDMREFRRPEAFELCLSLYTSFGYFERKGDDLAVLRNIHDSLITGGLCLIDVVGKEWLAKYFQPTTSHELENGALMVERHEICDDWSRIRNRWILIKDGKAIDYRFEHTIYSAQELKDRFAVAGFGSVEVFGSLDGDRYGLEAARLIAVARK